MNDYGHPFRGAVESRPVLTQKNTVSILRHHDRSCSACHARVEALVMVKAARETATAHFLFCRACATRIGVVGKAIGKRPTKPVRRRGER